MVKGLRAALLVCCQLKGRFQGQEAKPSDAGDTRMNGDCTSPASSELEVLARTHAPRLTQPGSACRGQLRCPTVGGRLTTLLYCVY